MAEVDYTKLPANSHKTNPPVPMTSVRSQETFDNAMNPKAERRVVSTTRGGDYEEPTGFKKFVKTFIKGDIKDVTDYVLEERLMPSIYDLILDWITGMLGMPSGGPRRRFTGSRSRSVVEYNSINDGPRNSIVKPQMPKYNDPNIVGRFESREDAIYVLTELDSQCSSEGMVSVSDYFQLIGMKKLIDQIDVKRGWGRSQIGSVRIIEDSDGYWRLEFPKTRLIEEY